ncbi:MAG: T9SS type A sorting domain-containing protein [Calditrichae bacterium]|nr:T9SS type A sorting domain-containing protein [Calditrichia bacterium]
MRIAAGENAEITVTSKRAVSVQISDWQMDGVVVQINRNGEQIQELPLQNGQQLQLGAGVSQLRIFKNSTAVPNQFEVFQNYPNPFNPVTEIRYQLPERSTVEIAIYNALGQKIKTLLSQTQEAGSHRIVWDATNNSGEVVSSGIYFYRVSAGSVSEMKRMVLLR